jgi:hypothetical protein
MLQLFRATLRWKCLGKTEIKWERRRVIGKVNGFDHGVGNDRVEKRLE